MFLVKRIATRPTTTYSLLCVQMSSLEEKKFLSGTNGESKRRTPDRELTNPISGAKLRKYGSAMTSRPINLAQRMKR
jgi:hypothetical protein